MKAINKEISVIKNLLEKRETYIRFSPIGTLIMGIMYILYFLYISNYLSFLGLNSNTILYTSRPEIYVPDWFLNGVLFLGIGVLGLIIVTILSIINSKNKGDAILPKSIRYIIINILLVLIISIIAFYPYFMMSTFSMPSQRSNYRYFSELYSILVLFSFLFYGFLILISRLLVPKYIKYFGVILFIVPLILLYMFKKFEIINIINYLILILFGFGHLIMGYLLHKNNK